jgi:hypothetical protein
MPVWRAKVALWKSLTPTTRGSAEATLLRRRAARGALYPLPDSLLGAQCAVRNAVDYQ